MYTDWVGSTVRAAASAGGAGAGPAVAHAAFAAAPGARLAGRRRAALGATHKETVHSGERRLAYYLPANPAVESWRRQGRRARPPATVPPGGRAGPPCGQFWVSPYACCRPGGVNAYQQSTGRALGAGPGSTVRRGSPALLRAAPDSHTLNPQQRSGQCTRAHHELPAAQAAPTAIHRRPLPGRPHPIGGLSHGGIIPSRPSAVKAVAAALHREAATPPRCGPGSAVGRRPGCGDRTGLGARDRAPRCAELPGVGGRWSAGNQ